MTPVLCALFFLSGAAALLFETLWFRQAGLAFGNSVWASSLVLSSFMAGLALGNGLMARHGDRIRRPLRCYAFIEAVIAIAGVALVLGLPQLGGWLAPVFRQLLEQPIALNGLRLGSAFVLLLLPATAMGATLPVLVKALLARDPNFGSVLGRLYGWNTLGAVAGAVAGEWFLIEWFGIRGTAYVAGGFDAVAAFVALLLSRRFVLKAESAPEAATKASLGPHAWRILAAAFTAGGLLLAFEVVWFRFMHLFVHSGGLAFALMLAVVLAGIAFGGFLGGVWLRRDADAHRHTWLLALAAGAVAATLYATFSLPLAAQANELLGDPPVVLWLSFVLMFPVALFSGVMFIFMGALLHREVPTGTRAAGLLTLSNTLGAALGSGMAGFLLLPLLGMETSFVVLSAAYLVVAALLWRGPALRAASGSGAESPGRRQRQLAHIAVPLAFVLAFALFPFGKMERVYLWTSISRWDSRHKDEVAAIREGRIETAIYLRSALDGETLYYRLLTDGFAMSGTSVRGRRYQKLYVYWPVALRPDPKQALVISYGVGSTAKALVDTRSLEHIDVVDISRAILDLSEIIYPDPADHPLRDPRVQVHIEDGRFFLQTSERRYDLITGEPPPPKNAGVVNLYTREYFQLIHDRLTEGGITTYWLPVHNTLESDTRAIIRAFCDVFEDCSLWSGQNLDWMLVGSRAARWTRSEDSFEKLWGDPALAPELEAVGLERPEQLGALFMADAAQLRALIGDAAPLVDDRPKRLGNRLHSPREARRTFRDWLDAEQNRERFIASEFIERAWPPKLRERSIAYFETQGVVDRSLANLPVGVTERLRDLHRLLVDTNLTTAPLLQLGISTDRTRAVDALVRRGAPTERHGEVLARRAVAEREYALATRLLEKVRRPRDRDLLFFRVFVLAMAGRNDDALELARRNRGWLPDDEESRGYWKWLEATFGLTR
jgi:spermidine synthase